LQVDDRVKEMLVIVAALLAIVNHGIQILERALKGLKWIARKLKALLKQKTHPNRQPTKPKRKR